MFVKKPITSRSYLRELFLYVPVKVIPAMTIFVLLLYFMRTLPAEQYVKYSLSVSIAAISVQIFSGWLAAPIVYYLPAAVDRHKFLVHSLGLSLFFSFVSAIFGGLTAVIFMADVEASILVGLASFAISFAGVVAAINQAERKVTVQIEISFISSLALVGAVLVLFSLFRADFRFGLFSLFFGQLSGSLLFLLRTRVPLGAFRKESLIEDFRLTFNQVFRYGSPLALWAGAMLVLNSGEKFFLTSSDIAATYVSFKDLLIGAASLLSMPLIMTAHPLIFKVHREGGNVNILIRSSATLLAILFGVVWTTLSSFGFDILQRLTEKNFQLLGHSSFFVLAALYLSAIAIYYQKPLEIQARTLCLATSGAVTALVALLAFAIFIPTYGPPAAATVFFGCQVLYLFIVLRVGGTPVAALALPLLVFIGMIFFGEALRELIQLFVQDTASISFLGLWVTLYYVPVGLAFLKIAKSIV